MSLVDFTPPSENSFFVPYVLDLDQKTPAEGMVINLLQTGDKPRLYTFGDDLSAMHNLAGVCVQLDNALFMKVPFLPFNGVNISGIIGTLPEQERLTVNTFRIRELAFTVPLVIKKRRKG